MRKSNNDAAAKKNRSDSSPFVKLLRNLAIFLSIAVFVSVFSNMRNKVRVTTVALMDDAVAYKEFKAVFIRDEEVKTYDGEGVLSYNVPDGGKLGNGTIIAMAYPTDEQLSLNSERERLRRQLSILKKIQNPGTRESAQPAGVSANISESYRKLLYDRDKKDYTAIADEMDDLLVLMSTYQIITHETEGFSQQITDIGNKLIELQTNSVQPTSVIIADRPAYFVSYSDGYEEALSSAVLGTVTAEQLNSVEDRKLHDKTIVGKMINGYSWHVAGVLDNSRHEFAVGEPVMLRFESSADTYNAVITDIRDSGDPSESVFIIECSEFNSDLVQHRAESAELIKDNYRGLRVPRDAIRFADKTISVTDPETGEKVPETANRKGVYTLKGDKIEFKLLDVIYEGTDYVLSGVHEDSNDYLALYDDILMEGVDPDYAGKELQP
ncbi:MAG: hypothetical protein J5501_05015 [Ruminococcus sp.]|nr:hypothetical protein [Ruminococcus sp.]